MASGTVAIRPATAEEAPALSELCRRSKAHWGYDDDFMAACVEELTVRPERYGDNEVWVAEDGAPVGLYELACDPDGVGDVLLFFVAPEAMGRGVGAALWSHMEQRAADRGLTRITVEADPYAAPFYERMGCRLTGRAPCGAARRNAMTHPKTVRNAG